MKKFGPSPVFIIPCIVIEVVASLLGIALLMKAKYLGAGFFVLVFLPLTFILLFINYRKIILHPDKICFHSLFSKRCFAYEELKRINVRKLGMRNVLWVEYENGLVVIPLVFSNLSTLKEAIKEKLGERVNSEKWQHSTLDIALLYLAAVFLIFVVLIKFI